MRLPRTESPTSMSTSRNFESLTALLWGDRWWIEGRAEALAFGDLHHAAEVLLAQFSEGGKPARLRLIFQPASLAAAAAACPRGSRDTLQLALGDQFPSLASDDRAWSFEPIVGGRDGFATVLYYETQAGLFALAQALHDGGIEIEGAWPLATVLNLVPEDWPDSGALTVVAVAKDQTLIFRHTPEGRREVEATMGDDASAAALTAVRGTLARIDTALYLVGCDDEAQRLASQLPTPDVPRVRLVSWAGLPRAASTLSLRQPSQLLPVTSVWNRSRALLVATAIAGAAALGLGADYARSELAQRDRQAATHREQALLHAEIERRRVAQQEVAALRTAVEAGAPSAPLFGPALRKLAAQLPREVVLTRLHGTRSGLTLEGGVTSAPTETAWRDWLNGIASASAWKFAERPPLPAADFRIDAVVQP